MANTTDTRHTCADCAFFDACYMMCKKTNVATRPTTYACHRFTTPAEWAKVVEEKKKEILRKEEERLNFILTGLYIMSTATVQMLEYFDTQFTDRRIESDWRFSRKRAANEIDRAVQKIRDIYQHTFMEDQTKVMTGHGTHDFDAEGYDNHEDDARRWNKLLLHHLECSWQDEGMEETVLKFYENLPHMGIFHPKDFRHFTTKH